MINSQNFNYIDIFSRKTKHTNHNSSSKIYSNDSEGQSNFFNYFSMYTQKVTRAIIVHFYASIS